jgi:hypothetical protein
MQDPLAALCLALVFQESNIWYNFYISNGINFLNHCPLTMNNFIKFQQDTPVLEAC